MPDDVSRVGPLGLVESHRKLRGGQRSTEDGGSNENTVFGDRRMSGLIAFKQRAGKKKGQF
jgi:hypothetical protein